MSKQIKNSNIFFLKAFKMAYMLSKIHFLLKMHKIYPHENLDFQWKKKKSVNMLITNV